MTGIESEPTIQDNFSSADIERIESMPEISVAQIQEKKTAFNNLILKLDRIIPMVHFESGSDQPDDQGTEAGQDQQLQINMDAARIRARAEMTRLGAKEHEELQQAA